MQNAAFVGNGKMRVLSDLEPKPVFHFFEEICSIPHGSGNVEAISDYLVKFARDRNLEVYQDALKNVIIVKEAAKGYEEQEPVILQGHMDMVAVKTPECPMDLKKDGLRLVTEGDLVWAEGTSLGGDDGIAVAYALAILDADYLAHPRLEVVITVDEEVGMDGARGIDLSVLKGKRLLNIDSEEEGIFTVGCAGGARVDIEREGRTEPVSGQLLEIKIDGLLGGHSGMEIHKERGNSNQLMGRLLEKITAQFPLQLVSIHGGLADNAIPRETAAALIWRAGNAPDCAQQREGGMTPEQNAEKKAESKTESLEKELEKFAEDVRAELAVRDPGFAVEWRVTEGRTAEALTVYDTRQTALLLAGLPQGVQAMSPDVAGLVETSLNLGLLRCDPMPENKKIRIGISVRSSVESEKEALIRRLCATGELAGAICSVRGDYPGWKYRVDSPLRDNMTELYREMYREEPEVVAIHAGLECGLLVGKIPDLDCVSFGPDMKNIHTTEETLSISSTKRVWEFLVKFLAVKT